MPDDAPDPSPTLEPGPAADAAAGAERERDRLLVERLAAGDEAAWREFHADYGQRIASAVRSAGIVEAYADDACSYVYEALLADGCARLERWNGTASLSTYLYRVARNLAVDYRRSLPRFSCESDRDIPTDQKDIEAQIELETRALQASLREPLLECLLRMPNGPDREMILLHYYLGLDAGDIARLSGAGRGPNAVHQALHRAKRSLIESVRQIHPELAEFLGET